MGFFEDKMTQEAPPPIPQTHTPPGAWWQTPAQQQSPEPPVVQPVQAPAPQQTGGCPRCGSSNYGEVLIDASRGGHPGKITKCWDCMYPSSVVPAPDAGGSAGTSGQPATKTRQLGNPSQGSWGANSWSSAQKVV